MTAEAIAPAIYPVQWIDRWQLAGGATVTVRPVLPQDQDIGRVFVAQGLTAHSRYQRFMISLRELPQSVARYFTRIDYHDHFALLAETFEGQDHRQVGDARFVRVAGEPQAAEFALAVADAWQGQGLGRRLLQAMVAAARAHGIRRLYGDVLRGNLPMLHVAQTSGFTVSAHPEEARLVRVTRVLEAMPGAAAPRTDQVVTINAAASGQPAAACC